MNIMTRKTDLSKPSAVFDRRQLLHDLAKARGEFPEIPRNRKATVKMKSGASYSYTYADLSDIFKATTPALSAWGLGVWQDVTDKGVVTTVYHESGETRVSSPWPIKPMPARGIDDCQSYQSAVQVAKRYCLQSALGISTEESIEGDRSRRTDVQSQSLETASSEGLRDAWRDGVLDALPENATDAEKAAAFADAIVTEFASKKSLSGVNGVWSKREKIIDALDAKHNTLFQNVFDAFHQRCDEIREEKGE